MSELTVLMILGAAAFGWWSAGRAAAERAERIGREACRLAGVQWLDQTVHASGLKLRRRDDGRLGVARSFRFEYSGDGVERSVGRLVLHGEELVAFVGPVGGEQVVEAMR